MGVRHSRHLAPVALWTAIWAAFFGTILLGKAYLPESDFSGQFHTYGIFQVQELAAGRLPVWSPGSYGGYPFAADPQSAVFYPPRWVTALLSLRSGLSYHALEIEALAHIWLAGVWTYLFVHGVAGSRLAGLAAAVAFGLGGYLTSYPLLQLAILETICWLPLALLALRRATRSGQPVPWLVVGGLVLALAATAGHPQTLLHVGYLCAAYYVFAALRAGRRWSWTLAGGGLAGALAVTGSAAVWLPAIAYLPYTTRQDVGYAFVSGGLPMLDYLQMLVPRALSVWSPQYAGLATFALAANAWAGRRSLSTDGSREVAFWAGATLAAAWLALGDEGILFGLAYRILPGFSLFRHQERLLGVVAFGLAVLGGLGAAAWERSPANRRWPDVRRSALVLGGGLTLAGAVLALAPGAGLEPRWDEVLARQAVLAVAVLAVLAAGARRRLGALALVVLMAADLYWGTHASMNRMHGSPARFWPRVEALNALRSDEPARIDATSAVYANFGEIYDLEDIAGISPLKPAALERLLGLPSARRWQLLNVRHVISGAPPEVPGLVPVDEIPDGTLPTQPGALTVYRYEDALPRAWFVHEARSVADDEEALGILADPAHDPARIVLLHDVRPVGDVASGGGEARVETRRMNPRSLSMLVECEEPGYLVISEWYRPGWRALVDGTPEPILRANYAFQAVYLAAGRHQVLLTYSSPTVGPAAAVSAWAVVLGVVMALRWRPAALDPSRPQASALLSRARLGGISWAVTCREHAAHCGRRIDGCARVLWARLPPCLGSPAWPAALAALALTLRLVGLGAQELRGDEAYMYLMARADVADILPAQIGVGEPHSPLSYYLLHGWMRLAGRSELALRIPSVVLGVLLVVFMYRLGRALWGPAAGVLAGLLTTVSQSLVWLAQDARHQYGLALVASTAATLILVRAMSRRLRAVGWAGYTLLVAITAYSHLYGLFAVLAHGAAVLATPALRRLRRTWLWSVGAAALLYAPWLMVSLPQVLATGQLQDVTRADLAMYLADVGTWVVSGSGLGHDMARWVLLVSVAATMVLVRRRERVLVPWRAILSVWLGSAVSVIYLVLLRRTMFNAFYLSLAAPAWWLLVTAAALGPAVKNGWRGSSWLAAGLVVALLAVNGLSLGAYYVDPALSRTQGYREVAAYLERHAEPGDVFVANWPDPCWDYYLEDVPVSRTMVPPRAGMSHESLAEAIAEVADAYSRVWLAPYRHSGWDPDGAVEHWLEHNALLERHATFGNLSVRGYRGVESAKRVLRRLEAGLEGRLRTLGYHVEVDGEPAEGAVSVSPGVQVSVTLAWEALARMDEGYTVFVHLVSAEGTLLAQHDGVPVFGTRPTWVWLPGEVILDRHTLTVPDGAAGGRALLVLGIYDSETRVRQAIHGGRDTVSLADVIVAAD